MKEEITIVNEYKIITGHGIIELINDQYIKFQTHGHVANPTLEYLKQDAEAFKILTNGKKYPIISFILNMDKIDPECEKFIKPTISKLFTKQAIVTTNRWTVYVFNIISGFMNYPIPLKLFSDEESAMKWIKEESSK